ncbi:hypothetical protein [Nitrosomonas nitrosa]|nr:hypothetical protein [Nitrosomonas nitrosa]
MKYALAARTADVCLTPKASIPPEYHNQDTQHDVAHREKIP